MPKVKGQTKISTKNQVTIPVGALRDAGMRAGDVLRAEADGAGRVVRGFFANLVTEILPVEAADAERAARMRADHRSLRMPDVLILAAADGHPDVDMVLTGDAGMAGVRGLGCRVSLLEPPA